MPFVLGHTRMTNSSGCRPRACTVDGNKYCEPTDNQDGYEMTKARY